MKSFLLTLFAVCCGACGARAQTCSIASSPRPIPIEIRETSGLAKGRVNPDVFWTHNDSGSRPEIFAIASNGTLRGRVRVHHALLADWEDMDIAPCGEASCLYIADIGDNAGVRSGVTIYELPEPALPTEQVNATRAIRARYADGPQDAEAFFRLGNDFYVVTKGRQKPIRLYRLVVAENAAEGVLQIVRELAPRPSNEQDRVTAATASPDGKWVAIRSYAMLYVYRADDLIVTNGQPALTFSLLPLRQIQGEAITLDDDGTIWLTSEAEHERERPTIAQVKCKLQK
jgi:hypothetical protein